MFPPKTLQTNEIPSHRHGKPPFQLLVKGVRDPLPDNTDSCHCPLSFPEIKGKTLWLMTLHT